MSTWEQEPCETCGGTGEVDVTIRIFDVGEVSGMQPCMDCPAGLAKLERERWRVKSRKEG